ncbi:hypothetical protein EK21DRAFT_110218 [Setomelanomma holmii]|uniref:Zn(2)-C6 fungal-type domain-containing protein n=1 Tax=Setomelanomma holmii TaxID=210430 RepID=A0A9P4HCR6_9PLEO|nr:hypothetical protein EK21DRAFT_110218 [Setomelanomma holmii]
MLGYISSTRQKSCYACVKSKRRCDLGYPFCKRCFVKGIDCKYPNASPREATKGGSIPAEVVIRQATPDLTPAPFTTSKDSDFSFDIDTISNKASIDTLFFHSSDSSGSSSSPESFPDLDVLDDLSSNWGWDVPTVMPPPQPEFQQPKLTRLLMPEYEVPSFLNEAQVSFIIRGLRSFVPSIAYTGSTAFLHKNLYQTHEPQAYHDCVAISALYLARTSQNQHILNNIITSKISALVSESRTWTLHTHLAAVQALITYQTILLYSPSPSISTLTQAQLDAAKHHLPLLELWSATLWKRAFTDSPSTPFPSAHAHYIFYESLRRTVLMSVFVRCAWSCLTKGGLADQVPVLARLPLTRDFGAWGWEAEEWGLRDMLDGGSRKELEDGGLVSYGEMASDWRRERRVEELDGFGRLLLAACRGKDDPRLLG